jgi:hypothetical protein
MKQFGTFPPIGKILAAQPQDKLTMESNTNSILISVRVRRGEVSPKNQTHPYYSLTYCTRLTLPSELGLLDLVKKSLKV